MIFTAEQLEYLTPDGDELYKFVNSNDVTIKGLKKLVNLDNSIYSLEGYHLITNIEEVLNLLRRINK